MIFSDWKKNNCQNSVIWGSLTRVFFFLIRALKSLLKDKELLMFLVFMHLPYPTLTDVGW